MNLEINAVMTFKLMSGEEVIAKVSKIVDEKYIELSEPLSVAPGPQGMGLVPSVFTSEADVPVVLNTNNITMYTLTADAVKMKYIETTTGLKIPEKKIVLG